VTLSQEPLRGVSFMGPEALVRIENLRKVYAPQNFFARSSARGRGTEKVALDGVNLQIPRGGVIGVAGESGCGKSTLANCLAGFEHATSGAVWFGETDLAGLGWRERRAWCARMQVIPQDAAGSFNPRFTAEEIVAEPLVIQRIGPRESRTAAARRLMERVGLPAEWAARRPHQFSGGQRQRLAIARALALQPTLLILDESFSALDAWTQSRMADLLVDLQLHESMTCLHIAHDLALLSRIADEIAVMDAGKIVEHGAPRDLLARPQHAATKRLVAAMPHLDIAWQGVA
jgi:ABC-type glutathione transport system ATPase component